MAKATQLTLSLQSKPGVLAKVSRVLADAGVNIIALSAAETAGRGKLRMIVSDPGRAKDALKAAKYRASEEPAITLTLDHRPGTLADITAKLAAAKINIKSAYATAAGPGSVTVVLTVSNAEKAERALG